LSDKQDEQIRILGEILKWTKFAGMKGVRDALNAALDAEQKRIVYQMSDGTIGMVEVGKGAGIASTSTISRYWGAWSKQGFGEFVAVQKGNRFKRTFDLEEVGIEVPQVKQNIKEQERPVVPGKDT